jgi:adenylate kinase family enzyme
LFSLQKKKNQILKKWIRKTLEPFFKRILEETDNQRFGWIIEGTPKHSVGAQIMLELELKPDFVIELEQSEQWLLMRNCRRLTDDEQLLSEESDASTIIKEFSGIVAEITSKAESVAVDTSRRFTATMEIISRVCQRELTMRKSLIVSQSSTPIDDGEEDEPGIASKTLLRSGNLFISQFGIYCPVCLQETGALVLSDLRVASNFLGRVLLFDTEKHRQLFIDDPLRFVLQLHPLLFPFVPKLSVLRNSELAARIAVTLQTELIRSRDVIARVARHQTTFGASVRRILATDKAVDATIFKIVFKAVLARHDCQAC